MKELLHLHWRLERNHIRRRLRYLSIYFDWAGTITYLYLAAFFVFLIVWYLYDPVGRIPVPVRQSIILGGQLLLIGFPAFWLLGGIVRAGFTPVLLSMADAHFLPISPIQKTAIIIDQFFWAASRRAVLAAGIPLLIYPILRILWPALTLPVLGFVDAVWILSAMIGLDIQWILAVPYAWLRRSRIFAWLKSILSVSLIIMVLLLLWRVPVGMNGPAGINSPIPQHGETFEAGITGFTGNLEETGTGETTGLAVLAGLVGVSPEMGIAVEVLAGALGFTIVLTLLVLRWYSHRSWAPILQQTEQVHTLRTLMRSRDKRALQRFRQQNRRGRWWSKLLVRVYVPSRWALSWKSMLTWKSLSLLSLTSLFIPAILARLLASGAFKGSASNPFEALLSPVLYQQFPVALFVLQGFVGLLSSWQEDLQQMEKFRLLPLYPQEIVISTVAPTGLFVGLGWAVAIFVAIPLRFQALGLAMLFALVQGFLGTVLVAREMLKDPSSYTSATGPERLLSAAVFILGPTAMEAGLISGQGLALGLGVGLAVSAGATVLWIIFMQNEYTLLRAKYGV